MNKQIKRLLACAHLEIAAENGEIDTNKVAERFAVLVIEECCSVVERSYKYSTGTPMSFWEMSQDVQDKLRLHFSNVCVPCRNTGMIHCSDPANCGGPWDLHGD